MTDTEPATTVARRRLFVDLSPLRESPAAGRLIIGSAIASIGGQMTIVAIGLQVYDITHSTFAVSLVGGFALVPLVVFGIYSGMLADVFDRRKILLVSAIIAWGSTITIAALALFHTDVVWLLYVFSTLTSTASAVSGSLRYTILPRLLPARLLPASSALSGIGGGLAVTVGPALAGVLVASVGFPATYGLDVLLFVAAFWGIVTLPQIIPIGTGARGWASIRSGLAFLRTAPTVRISFLADVIAMTLGRPNVLFPAAAVLLIGGGPITVGVLTAAGAVGALLGSLFSGRLEHVHRYGVAITWAIGVYGACIFGMGLVFGAASLGWFGPVTADWGSASYPAIALSSLMMVGAGASDSISSILRQTILQTSAPDDMRGRLQGIFTVVVNGGPRLGDLYVGIGAALTALWFPPALGGILIIVLIAVLLRVTASFRNYDARNPTP
jgi:MFS family permease